MKRLIMVSMMLISGLAQAEGGDDTEKSSEIQLPHDVSPKDGDEDSSFSIANVHQINLDTTEVDGGGNWLNKRIWYERAQTVFDEIRVMVNTIGDLRIQFSNEVNTVGQKIDSFFETVDFTKSQLDDKFKEILVALDTEQKIVGDLSEEERTLQTTIKQELLVIDQIGRDIKSIGEVDNKIDQTLMQAFKTIDECREYETKAWDTFKSIGKELDDKKARNFYYQMNNYKQNIDQKSSYLKSTLLPYLHNVLVAKIETNISKINEAINQLKTKGVDLEKIMSKTQEDDVIQVRNREKAAAEIAVKKALEIEQEKSKEAAEIAAKALEEEKKKSFSNIVNHYYELTIGKIVKFVHQAPVPTAINSVGSYFKSYSYPVATHIYNATVSGRAYMHDLVERLMVYFGGKPVAQSVVVEKIAEKVVENKVLEKSVGSIEATSVAENLASVVVAEVSEPSHATEPVVETTAPTQVVEVKEISAVEVVPTPSDATVVVQSMKNDDTTSKKSNDFYQVFKTILDLIGTVFVSVYNCIVQFFKLLLSFSTYIMSSN